MNPSRSLFLVAVLAFSSLLARAAEKVELKPGENVALIGNALADRMQHHGWLETLVHARLPKHNLIFRNLAASGDEVAGFTDKPDAKFRMRSENFGTSDDWLKRVQADVVWAFFGYNESFAGDAGLDKFKTDLGAFIKHTRGQNYSGKASARVVLFAPISAEASSDANRSPAAPLNTNLKKYAAAMAEVAKANDVPFVDLFGISADVFDRAAKQKQSLTFNAVHLTEAGDKALAPEAFRALFGETAPGGNLEKLRAAVLDKNFEWHRRYRTVDGYNVYGGRSGLAFEAGKGGFKQNVKEPEAPLLSNYQTMQDEMKQRDAKTANRDKRIWAVAKGGDLKVADDNLPPVRLLASSNKPDVKPFLSGEEAIKHMTLPKGAKVTLVADEVRFPELASPVQMGFDPKGRLWVAAWPSYPELRPTDKVFDKLLVFDLGADGKAKKVTTFLDGLNCPTGFQFHKDGVLVVQAPDVWFARDTNGDGKADWKERVVMGLDSADSHHTANAMAYGPGGDTFLSDGVFHRTQMETAYGPPVRNSDGCIYRWEPLTGKLERYVPYGFANPHGKVFDRWGNDIITDATGNANYFAPAFSGFISEPAKHGKLNEFWKRPFRPCAGTAMISSRHFPEDWQGNFLNCNVIGYQGIFRVKVTEDGAGLKGETLDITKAKNDAGKEVDKLGGLVVADTAPIPNFRPSCVAVAPDGSIYFCDWAKELIGHMQHHLRDPNRDKTHGRIYRITFEGRPLLKPVKIDGEPIEKLLAALTTPEDDVRTRAKIELGKHDSAKVIAATKKWAAGLSKADKEYQHHMMEALWVHQWHNVVDEAFLKQMLRSPDYRARAAATRVLCYWRDRVKDPLALLKVQAADDHPRVRLEAIRACSFFTTSAAAEVALGALEKEADPNKPDYYIKYCLDETLKQLGKYK
ncbi:MAG: azurin [Verrucomicrobia bacterium]|nr:azurin [Verrucomicrobiota bacterium]